MDKIVKSLTDAFAATQGLVDLEEATQSRHSSRTLC